MSPQVSDMRGRPVYSAIHSERNEISKYSQRYKSSVSTSEDDPPAVLNSKVSFDSKFAVNHHGLLF